MPTFPSRVAKQRDRVSARQYSKLVVWGVSKVTGRTVTVMAYIPCVQPVPVRAEIRTVDWLDLVGTWVIVGLLGAAVWIEWNAYQRGRE